MKVPWLWLHVIILLVQCQRGCPHLVTNSSITDHLCNVEEAQFLLQLKQLVSTEQVLVSVESCPDIPTNYSKLMSWSPSRDCCLWDGVTCHRSTGHVIGLDLSCSSLMGNLHSNSTLFRLTHLRRLNLAYNDFSASQISFKFGQLNRLTHLNLSSSGFSGHIPVEFYHLSNLVELDISPYYFLQEISLDIKRLFGNMTKLRVALLGRVNISSELPLNMSSFLTHLDLYNTQLRGDLPASIFDKPHLQILTLSWNPGLTGSLPSFNRSNVRLMEQLDLKRTSISGRLPDSIGFMSNLKSMDLSRCKFSGHIPDSIGNLTKIRYINLRSNEYFTGQLPSTIGNLGQLTELDLSWNRLQGQLPDTFSGLQKLTALRLVRNRFTGTIPYSLTNLSRLESMYISYNELTGRIPASLTNMSKLMWLQISSNKLTGPFPATPGDGLQQLYHVDLFNNSIQGTLPSWLLSLPSLAFLDLSYNRLTGEIGSFNSQSLTQLYLYTNQLNIQLESIFNLSGISMLDLSHNIVTEQGHRVVNVTLPSLRWLELGSCEIKHFPNMLTNLPSLSWLDLSDNKIHGPTPSWFSTLQWAQNLTYLNLSGNCLTHVTDLPWQQLNNLRYLDLHSNSLQGTIPSLICNMTRLSILNLSENKLRGPIPECIGTRLEVLDLRRNELQGSIPSTFGGMTELMNLGLNGNHLEGTLPPSLANCTNLEVIDVGNNMIQDTFPWWLENLTLLMVLILKSNRFHGSITPPVLNNSLSKLQIIDLSYNNFTGILPEEFFAGLQAMKKKDEAEAEDVDVDDLYLGSRDYLYTMTLSVKGTYVEFSRVFHIFTTIDLSRNNFVGHIPESISDLSLLRLLNVSHNSMSGGISRAFGRMTKLEQLDLSSNQLTGEIPQILTNLTFLAVLNLSHNTLVGPIPKGNQFLTFSNESYIGNSGLCGTPLATSCGDEIETPSTKEFDEGDNDDLMMGFNWKVVMLGYGCGIVVGFVLGYVMIEAKWLIVYVEKKLIFSKDAKRRDLPL